MRITDILDKQCISLNEHPTSKKESIEILGNLMDKSGKLKDKQDFLEKVFQREETMSTGLGEGIATPHAKADSVAAPGLAAITVPEGVDFKSLDGNPTRLIFMIAAPENADAEHLEIMSSLATMIMDADFKEALIKAKTPEEFLGIIDSMENGTFSAPSGDSVEDVPKTAEEETSRAASKKVQQTNNESTAQTAAEKFPEIIAVTACPTGIAHTYMAADSLEKHAKQRGISIKVETNGSSGTKNLLTPEEIHHARAVIIAADKQVELKRFQGKPLLFATAADGINKADILLDKALSNELPIFESKEKNSDTPEQITQSDTLLYTLYKHLMNGVSHMLPVVVGGGIMIAIAFLLDDYSIDPKNFGSNTPIAKFFKDVGGTAFGFMLPVLSSFIAMSIADRPGLAVGLVGGALAASTGSGFIGALLAGFLGGYIILLLKKVFAFLPDSLDGIRPMLIYPFFGVLLIGFVSIFIIAPPVSAINSWLLSSIGSMDKSSMIILGTILGGMMAVDMGGPINKAAYIIGTGALADGEFHLMAAVMAGGMVPPLAIALCTTFFGNRFTANERKAGITNYVMGLAFITEGAIPFAAADPIRVIPSCAIAAATAGGLSMLFDCTLMAPHGGIFVVPTIGHPMQYLLSIFIGSAVGCILMAILKKKQPMA